MILGKTGNFVAASAEERQNCTRSVSGERKSVIARLHSAWRPLAVLGGCAAVLLAGIGSAQAFLSTTQPLPLLGSPYTTSGGTCFSTAGLCVAGGAFTLTSVVPGGFVQGGAAQFINAYATDVVQLTNLASVPIGSVTLTGTIRQEVLGRLSPNETGSWQSNSPGCRWPGWRMGTHCLWD